MLYLLLSDPITENHIDHRLSFATNKISIVDLSRIKTNDLQRLQYLIPFKVLCVHLLTGAPHRDLCIS